MNGEPIENEQSPTAGTFCECDAIDDPLSELRQGDVFEWNGPAADPWRRYGIVVTADCDIAHEKNAGILSYVPLLAVTDYLAAFYLPKQIARLLIRVDEKLVSLVRGLQSANLPAFPSPLTPDVVTSWLDETAPESVADEIKADGADREQLLHLAALRKQLAVSIRSGEITTHMDAICNTRQFLHNGRVDDIRTKLCGDIQSHLKDLPGDALFIRALTISHSSGFVAYLRFVRELKQTAVAIRQSDLSGGAQARRIGRLRAPYVYRLTQMLGIVFSSIGLPREYETARHEIVALLQRNGHLGK